MHTSSQHQHIATVMQVAADGAGALAAAGHEQAIRDSWHRCVHEHRLDPTRMQEAVILPQARLREHQDQMEALLQIARTCAVGTCISTGEALTVHLDDHFDATHIPLTCTTAPVDGKPPWVSASRAPKPRSPARASPTPCRRPNNGTSGSRPS